ncbi:MAG: RecQ family ATP-dependent DNA helicase [Pseudomonadota bacterium]
MNSALPPQRAIDHVTAPASQAAPAKPLAPRCLSIDLEVGKNDGRIHSFAAVRADTGEAQVHASGDLQAALTALDAFAEPVSFLLGHNLAAFDLPHLAAANPSLKLLHKPVVDTLRLSPLAFPCNPYHRLVKHYQDGQLFRERLNDPELDARLALDLFREQVTALRATHATRPDLVLAWHWLSTDGDQQRGGLDAFFMTVRGAARPTAEQAQAAMLRLLASQTCSTQAQAVVDTTASHGWALAYALSWLSVAGGNSVMPPWVRHQFPAAAALVRQLRDTRCDDPACTWCAEYHDARKELKHWTCFDAFRPEPAHADGRPLQQHIVEAAMQGRHALGILPTGTGKSLCYQVPALSRYRKTGALTVVISPLVALMADQVAGLEARGIRSCAALNGLLSMPERKDVLARVRLGDVAILIVSPEQLRNQALRKVLAQREIGAWVLDEAHCLSKWGQDFRPDYRYVGRFIREKAAGGAMPTIQCLTATAKPEVIADIVRHFRDQLGVELELFDGGANRSNLAFSVVASTPTEKYGQIHQLLQQDLSSGGAIVYCASRKQTQEVSAYLRAQGWRASHFHAGMQGEAKKSTQRQFIGGELQVIAATNAFGMGIDKSDVRLVVHADIPGSLENYLQEAGRAGRDLAAARCVLLYTAEDVERQFGMSARSRLTQREIQSVLRALRKLDRKKRSNGEVIATAGEILAEEDDGAFARDATSDDTRVRTAISWLEEADLLTREENYVQVFPSSLRVASMDEADARLARHVVSDEQRGQLLALVRVFIGADAEDGISTDELMAASGMSSDKVRAALYALEKFGIASNDMALTAFLHAGVSNSSQQRLAQAAALETALIAALRAAAPDLARGGTSLLQLRHATQALKDEGHAYALPEKLARIVSSLATDGLGEDGAGGSVHLRRLDAECIELTLQREWSALARTAELRRAAAARLLEHLLAALPTGARGTDLLAETTLGKLHAAINEDLELAAEVADTAKLLDRALLWLHEQEVIRLNKGMAVFRSAMTIRLDGERRNFTKADFTPLKLHYDEQVIQIHVMAEYVQRGLQAMNDALGLAMDYFRMERDTFIQRWLPAREKELTRQTTPASWRRIVEELNNRNQQRIVSDEREQTNVLVLAGPGAGKTRVLVHRIAFLLRARREPASGILALAYNRHAAVQIRRRLADLVGDDARGVTVMTCHALAMRLVGASFSGRAMADETAFREVMQQAVALLRGEGLPPDEADEQRDKLLSVFRWILVDEYQDIGPDQYALISALAGRTRSEEDGRLGLFAVGDDDQNIYAFDGASVEFIRRFEQDYAAKPAYLVENYRSTRHIIDSANALIAAAPQRMKAQHPITIDAARANEEGGGAWARIDPLGMGRVQILPVGANAVEQAMAVMQELERLASLDPSWDWARVAVIAREWKTLEPVRCYCEVHGIAVQMADEEAPPFWRLRETQALVAFLREQGDGMLDMDATSGWLDAQAGGAWWSLLREALDAYTLEMAGAELPGAHLVEWLAEWGREIRRRQTGLLLLSAHRAKGLEFDHVAILDGGWQQAGRNEDEAAPRRLYYVAMTRARQTLTLARHERPRHALLDALPDGPGLWRRDAIALPAPQPDMLRHYQCATLKDVDIGFPSRLGTPEQVRQAIAELAAGAPLMLRVSKQNWELADMNGRTVGRMARAFAVPAAMRCVSVRVAAVVVRRRDDSESPYREQAQCESWEVLVPELVFEPAG